MGYVNLADFDVEALRAANAPAIRAIYEGVVEHKPFLV